MNDSVNLGLPRRIRLTGDPTRLGPESRAARAAFPLALVAMPFHPPFMPSIQLGLLSAISSSHGFPTRTFHLGLDLAARLSPYRYAKIALEGDELGNWLFSVLAFGADAPDPEGALVDAVMGGLASRMGGDRDAAAAWLQEIRTVDIPAFLDEVASSIDWGRFRVVGFTTTFQQKTASFALARRIKERWPDTLTLFGGANFDHPMGEAWMRAVPWIDLAINGEADLALPALLNALAEGSNPLAVPGVLGRAATGDTLVGPPNRPLDDIEDLPVPDYSEYFDRAHRLGLLGVQRTSTVELPFQAARGCWWGEKSHCTFCGISDETLRYRAKSPARVRSDLTELNRRYGSFRFVCVDLILDKGYFDGLLEELARDGVDFGFWWELKANLSREQLRQLRAGGVHTIQPGIESLSSRVLALMRKGSRAVTNVNLLRWAAYYGLDVRWNLIWGFPGENHEDVLAQAELVPSLVHLSPPGNIGGISIDRYSPLFDQLASQPGSSLRPTGSFLAVYPGFVDFPSASFSFDVDIEGSLAWETYAPLIDAVRAWGAAAAQRPTARLTAQSAPGLVQIDDRRYRGRWRVTALEDAAAAVYMSCFDEARSARAIAERLDGSIDADKVESILDELCEARLAMRDGNLFLALALPATPGR